ncbi:ADP-ribosylglycohydrolase family protein [Paenibacillus zeisoli]|uniref:ADP-ribosylglycohydrolase family protein n=1 Tax=Paenibacillus zeisoli TaxID=2496267 RepID=A0A433XNL7_9BACL|nr:ADP-ribosylglycohydrolase family protein [Paenibacillus zeisoli]RUT35656.1 ADP-ribosylglycohydrolase family protein [Paenibacillus zeisoli]
MNKIKSGILGLCIGDALGVPVEFLGRDLLKRTPLTDMIGYGSHQQPAGTWSDDASLTLCLVESLAECGSLNLNDLAAKCVDWLRGTRWTPHGEVFDIGIATRQALERIAQESVQPERAGGEDEFSNGNGSLMRILPLAYYLNANEQEDFISAVTGVSSITHRHPISILACVFYVKYASYLIRGKNLQESYLESVEYMKETFPANPYLARYERLLSGQIAQLEETEIQSSGYVIHTLEASVWSLLTTNSYQEAVLRAVNLGEDTDTTGAVTGGLAGIYYGLEGLPQQWVQMLARADDIDSLCERFETIFN